MRLLVLVSLLGCFGGAKKSASVPASPEPVSELVQHERLDEPMTNAQVSADAETASGRRYNTLRTDKAARHRRLLVSWKDIVVSPFSGSPTPPAAPPAQPLASPEQKPEKLVIEAWLDLQTDDVGKVVDSIRARIVSSGGRMVSENVHGSGKSATSAAMVFRVPPAQSLVVTDWLGTIADVRSKRLLASDVGKKLFDLALALENLQLTMERLQKLAAQSGPVADLLTIEKEMTRVRGEIEQLKGEQRWLLDRVELATITVEITRSGDGDFDYEDIPEARVYPGPQLAMLTLFDPGMRQRTRVGGGVNVRVHRYATFELDVFPRGDDPMDSRAVLATFGSALYSSYLRNGRRRYFNPYIGGRIGYGYLGGNGSPVIAGELGIEWFKHKYFVVDSSLRVLAYMTSTTDGALHGTMGVSVPF
ncbi:MAG TPA: DUF4349 domain-containing protein [Kofleriaceae bacterium]